MRELQLNIKWHLFSEHGVVTRMRHSLIIIPAKLSEPRSTVFLFTILANFQ